jgi:hypothetical protein
MSAPQDTTRLESVNQLLGVALALPTGPQIVAAGAAS